MSGSSQGWPGDPLRLWNANDQGNPPTRSATNEHASCNWAAYWQPFAIAIGMLWAVKANCVLAR